MASDPTQVPVQYNLKIPWAMKQFLAEKAERERISQNQLGVDALEALYGEEFREYEVAVARRATRVGGASS